ncbi:hypothetical protein BEN74_10360 [Acinetobacter sp. WCHAc010034]|uniref:hypothetical protein n=1 Tax=Acinetobacter sp. WCHAc010034 TaxID=1879049 RepID=UPI00083AC5DD|nr:hypothetical protein [Acinetobacter sp. WCHAc010034]AYA03193.1 hypothetical protein BEN74_10360 [Acinetobacter sp. WCHAc010034]
MILRKILMLDDGNISESIEGIERKLRREGIQIHIQVLNPQDHKFKTEVSSGNFEIDFDKIKKEITENHKSIKYDVVACDFNFSSDTLNGYMLIQWLINIANTNQFPFRKAKFVCYSSEENKFKDHIIHNDELIKLIKLNIHAFYQRKNLVDDISALVKKINNNFSMSEHLKMRLNEMPDLKFQKIYPNFKNKTLYEISEEINKESHHGLSFQKYFVDLTYAHIIELNK